jgi:hypothetical protein
LRISSVRDLQRMLERKLGEVPRLILNETIKGKLVAEGIDPNNSLVDQLAAQILIGESDSFLWDDGTDRLEKISLIFTEEDVAAVEDKCTKLVEAIPSLIDEISSIIAKDLLKTLNKKWRKEYSLQTADQKAFRSRLEDRWGKALGKLRMLVTISMELGSEYVASNSDENALLRDVLIRLHVRACQVSAEVINLMEGGFADGAMARWRTLHEISIVTVLIVEHGMALAERYLAHGAVEAKAGKEQYLLCHAQLGYEPLTEQECHEIDDAYDRAIAQFGKDFRLPYGWAEGFVPKNRRGVIGLAELEAAAGRSALASHYKLASHNVHAGPHALFFRLGLIDDSVLLAGASNAGLSEPGQNTAISLALITILGVADKSTLDGVAAMKVIQILEREVCKAFANAEKALEVDHARHSRR